MNLYHVQDDSSWLEAPKRCRAEFLEAIAEVELQEKAGHTAQQTKAAWNWYLRGWMKGCEP